jgi:hypothetical protein
VPHPSDAMAARALRDAVHARWCPDGLPVTVGTGDARVLVTPQASRYRLIHPHLLAVHALFDEVPVMMAGLADADTTDCALVCARLGALSAELLDWRAAPAAQRRARARASWLRGAEIADRAQRCAPDGAAFEVGAGWYRRLFVPGPYSVPPGRPLLAVVTEGLVGLPPAARRGAAALAVALYVGALRLTQAGPDRRIARDEAALAVTVVLTDVIRTADPGEGDPAARPR